MRKQKNKLSASERLSNLTEIPFDMVGCLPYIKMCSNREVTIEDAGSILHYDGENIKLMQKKMRIEIEGRGLKILCLSGNNLRICGFITGMRFE